MKRIKFLLIGLLFLSLVNGYAQTSQNKNHENHYKAIEIIETNDFKMEFSNAHSQTAFSLVKIKMTNKSNDYLEINPSMISFKYTHGSYNPTGKPFLIAPHKSNTKTFKVTGDSDFHVDNLEIILTGFRKIPLKGSIIEVDQFQLPASNNNFEVNGLICSLSKSSQETKETSAKFECVNGTGKLLIVSPSKLAATSEKTTPYANDAGKAKMKMMLVEEGEEFKLVTVFHIPGKLADMQFTTLMIDWRDTFISTQKTDIDFNKVLSLEIDPGLTAGKNK